MIFFFLDFCTDYFINFRRIASVGESVCRFKRHVITYVVKLKIALNINVIRLII